MQGSVRGLLLVVLCAAGGNVTAALGADGPIAHLRELYSDCFAGGDRNETHEECVSGKVVVALDGLARARTIPLGEGLALVGPPPPPRPPAPLSEASLDGSLPRGAGSRQDAIYSLLLDRVAEFARSHAVSIRLAGGGEEKEEEGEGEGQGEAAVTGRRRPIRRGLHRLRKMLLPFLVGVVLKLGTFLPAVLMFMTFLALKTLATAKLALVVTAIMGMRKLLGGSSVGAGLQDKPINLLGPGGGPAGLSLDYGGPHDLYPGPQAAYAAHAPGNFYGRAFIPAARSTAASPAATPAATVGQ